MPEETCNDFDSLVTRLGGNALFDMIAGKNTWHGLVHGIAMGVAHWAAETKTEPMRRERDAALIMLEEVRKSLEPHFLPVAGSKNKVCKSCGVLLYESGIGVPHKAECLYSKVCAALTVKKT